MRMCCALVAVSAFEKAKEKDKCARLQTRDFPWWHIRQRCEWRILWLHECVCVWVARGSDFKLFCETLSHLTEFPDSTTHFLGGTWPQ